MQESVVEEPTIDNDEVIEENEEIDNQELPELVVDTHSKIEEYYYYVNFLDDDGTVLQRTTFKYGSKPSFNKKIDNKRVGDYVYVESGFTGIPVGQRHVYALDVLDIAEYVNDKNKTMNKEYVYQLFRSFYIGNEASIWLRSATEEDQAWLIFSNLDMTADVFQYRTVSNKYVEISPAFVIDLLAPGVNYTIN